MTHTHHRRGSKESLQRDFVVLSMIDPAIKEQHTYKGPLSQRVSALLQILAKFGPVAVAARNPTGRLRYMEGWDPTMDSGIHRSATLTELIACDDPKLIGHAVYTRRDAIGGVLRALKEADLGISIVVSGVFDEVFEACREAGVTPHTVNMSLGTWGKTELLPAGSVLELCTMCGHAMISRRLVERMIELVKNSEKTPEEAAVELGKQCTCNIFNTVRAAEIIQKETVQS